MHSYTSESCNNDAEHDNCAGLYPAIQKNN